MSDNDNHPVIRSMSKPITINVTHVMDLEVFRTLSPETEILGNLKMHKKEALLMAYKILRQLSRDETIDIMAVLESMTKESDIDFAAITIRGTV